MSEKLDGEIVYCYYALCRGLVPVAHNHSFIFPYKFSMLHQNNKAEHLESYLLLRRPVSRILNKSGDIVWKLEYQPFFYHEIQTNFVQNNILRAYTRHFVRPQNYKRNAACNTFFIMKALPSRYIKYTGLLSIEIIPSGSSKDTLKKLSTLHTQSGADTLRHL